MTYQNDVDIVSRLNGLGSLTSAQTNNFLGINHRGVGNPVPINSDNYGLTFFTRPRLNLSYDNIANSRVLTSLMSRDDKTVQRAIRVMLDSRSDYERVVTSPLVDTKQAFIPLLTNNLLSVSGWPDVVVDSYTSKEGNYRESWSMVDGTSWIYNTYDITASFRNIAGDPISLLFYVWVHYASMVYTGEMVPWPDMIIENEIDYNTRIYRLVLDPSRRYVQKIGATGAAYPTNSPLGASFNYSSDGVLNRDNDQISISFKCMGANYLDPILIQEFNETVEIFNAGMRDAGREDNYTKLDKNETYYFNYNGYPRINPDTFELEWWVDKQDYRAFKGEG